MPGGGARDQYLGHFVKCSIAVLLSSQLSTSIHIPNVGAWNGRLSVHRYRLLDSCTGVGLGFKI